MPKEPFQSARRRFIKLAAALVSAPFATVLFNRVANAESLSESDSTAAALGYKMDAAQAPGRKDKNSVCANCSLYSGKRDAPEGSCSIFGGKLVNAKGWCTTWAKEA